MKTDLLAPRRGTALIVVLMFVALMTVVALAFFMKSTAFRALSQSGVSEFKADTLGQSALEITVADLRQEIINGSNVTTAGDSKIYVPKAPIDMLPRRSGNPAVKADGTDPVPNLVRRSVRSEGVVAPAVSSRASAVSTLDPSRNGKYISAARWNKHYLIPRDAAKYGTGNTVGTEPTPEFVVPDWVYVTGKGPETLTAPSASVIGRYAYAIYDEGGLLDINVAGYPSQTPLRTVDSTDTSGKVWGSGNKGGAAAADLTVLGLTQKEVDQIVGWRAYASSQPSGTLPDFSFDTAAALRYHNSVRPHESAGLSAAKASLGAGGKTFTDQLFTSRQQLLKFQSLIGFPQDALQYLGTFSRDLDQPSLIPNPNRPKVQSAENNNKATYGTGNDAFGLDRELNAAKDINPPFPMVRTVSSFARSDGTTAKVGEPLVKKRFPLSRLKQVLRTATASKDPDDPIYRDFGIYRSSATGSWLYDHGDSTGILRLEKVAEEGREPDFFELLKAAINVGSLGKGAAYTGWGVTGTFASLQHYGVDVLTNLQVLQIGANIIDQYDSDGHPSRIAFSGDTVKEVRGVESLPYLYRIRLFYVEGVTPPAGSPVTVPTGSMLLTPEIWNPHGSPLPVDAPSRFRIRAENVLGSSVPTTCKINYVGGETETKPVDWSSAGVLTFDSDGTLFREPVVLAEPNVPAGSSLSGTTRVDSLATPQKLMTGLVFVEFPIKKNGKDVDTGNIGTPDHGPLAINLEYFDGSGYRVYDQQIIEWVDSKFTPKNIWRDYQSKNFYEGWVRTDPRTSRWGANIMDLLYLIQPIDVGKLIFPSAWPTLNAPPYAPKQGYPRDNGFVNVFANYPNNDLPPNSESKNRGFAQGYWTQNTVRNQKGFYGVADKPFYNRDPDGVARRAMGAYSSDADAGGTFTTTAGLPMVTNNNDSRPIVLNRPFRSVAELGYTFRGTPWKNLDFSFPESGDFGLLDVFSVDETRNDDALAAGRVNLNTRQIPVLQALLAGAITKDVDGTPATLDKDMAKAIASKLLERTTSTGADKGPLLNRSDLVGRWKGTGASPATPSSADPSAQYTGFSSDLSGVVGIKSTSVGFIPSQRDSVIRALVDGGTTRTWNLMVDLVAQSGRFPSAGGNLTDFVVDGEKRYWLHVAIDRLTGEVLDRRLEVVTE